jgi:hypothetical protein
MFEVYEQMRGNIVCKMDCKKITSEGDWSGERRVSGCCEEGNERLGSTKGTIIAFEEWLCCLKKVSPFLSFSPQFVGKHHVLITCGCVSVITRIVNLCSRWWWMVNFMLQPLYPRGLRPWNEKKII